MTTPVALLVRTGALLSRQCSYAGKDRSINCDHVSSSSGKDRSIVTMSVALLVRIEALVPHQ